MSRNIIWMSFISPAAFTSKPCSSGGAGSRRLSSDLDEVIYSFVISCTSLVPSEFGSYIILT